MCLFAATSAWLAGSSTTWADDAHLEYSAFLESIADSVQALADGDPARAEISARAALVALPMDPDGRGDLALGLALRDQSRFAEAAGVLSRAIPRLRDPALAAQARFERAQALFYSGHSGAAAMAFAELASVAQGPLAQRARWREADALLEADAPALAVRSYQKLLAFEPTSTSAPGARLSLARALRAGGDASRAIATYRGLWMDLPDDPTGRAAGQALRAWRAAGGPVPPPTPEQRLARAGRFIELALPRRALRVLDRLDASSPPAEPATRSSLFRALALLQLGRRDEAHALALRIQGSGGAGPGTLAGAELVLARVAARSGRVDEASSRYRAVAGSRERVPGLPPGAARDLPEDARFMAVWVYYDAGQFARAAELLGAYARAHPSARRSDDARWFAAWSLHRLGRDAEARRALSKLTRGPLAAAALYWQARLGGDGERELYRRVLHEAPPGSWYALLAAGRLSGTGEGTTPLAPAQSPPLPDGSAETDPSDPLSRAARLLGAGLRGEAIAELRAFGATRRARGRAELIAQLAASAGDAELPFRMARDHLAQSRRSLRWLFPLAFPDLLPSSAHQAGCDPELYLAIMRRESAFRPDARSGAGAIGLVQLIPATAERLAQVEGVHRSLIRRLELPEVSIPLGAAYLALLGERFRDPAVVLAAYNAGPVAAAPWARDRARMPLDEWVEDIPFRETRRYVKNVTADAVLYRALWRNGVLAVDGRRPIPAPVDGVGF